MPYVQHTEDDVRRMLELLGLPSVEALFRSIPEEILLGRPLDIPARRTESEITEDFRSLASRNRDAQRLPSFLGAGVYNRFIPAVVDYLSSRGEFSTAYTPYQPEVSQGTLQAVFEYQTLIARLTGMDLSNASMYEGGTALAEAILMAYAVHGKGSRALVSEAFHPEFLRVLDTYTRHHPIEIVNVPLDASGQTDVEALSGLLADDVFAVAVQNPNFFGLLERGEAIRSALDDAGLARPPLFLVSVDPISLGVVRPPGDHGADIVIGDGQSLGNAPNLGGPTFAFFATRSQHVRKVPGRIVGETRDAGGRRGFVLTFQTREQHIRRERATSNICTNQGLCCLRGAMMLAFLGERGLQRVAELSTRMAHHAEKRLTALNGVRRVFDGPFFQEFVIELPRAADEVYRELLRRGVRGGLPLGRYDPARARQMLVATTEMTTLADVELLERELAAVISGDGDDGPATRRASPRQSTRGAAARR